MSSTGPKTSTDLNDNESPGDGAWEDDLTEERDATPQERSDVADTEILDP